MLIVYDFFITFILSMYYYHMKLWLISRSNLMLDTIRV